MIEINLKKEKNKIHLPFSNFNESLGLICIRFSFPRRKIRARFLLNQLYITSSIIPFQWQWSICIAKTWILPGWFTIIFFRFIVYFFFFFFLHLRNFPLINFPFSPEFSLSVLPHWSLRCLLVCGSDIVQSLPCEVASSVSQTQNSRRFVATKHVFLSSWSVAHGIATSSKVCSFFITSMQLWNKSKL